MQVQRTIGRSKIVPARSFMIGFVLASFGCSSDDPNTDDATGGLGNAQGGAALVGGAGAGVGGAPSYGGIPTAGGVPAYGGASYGGASTGGMSNGGMTSGGTTNGGTTSGGMGSGGLVTNGGAPIAGGSPGSGGSATGGSDVSGGRSGSGGSGTGGSSLGGAPSQGGSSQGGQSGSGSGGDTPTSGGETAFWPGAYSYQAPNSGNVNMSNHYTGQNCTSCHSNFTFAGNASGQAQIGVSDGNNSIFVYTATSGAYWASSGSINWANAEIRIRGANGNEATMPSGETPTANCNQCHSSLQVP